jgi:hypothetical protein
MLTVVNRSSRVHDDDALEMARVCAMQLWWHAGPAWKKSPVPVVYAHTPAAAPPGSVVIGLVDSTDEPGALGWHTEGPNDVEYGEIAVSPVLDNGGDVLHSELSVASVLSHEVLEWFIDPHCNLYADTGEGFAVALEVGDPVEADSYALGPDGITVSNFVFPAWFDPQAPAGARYDVMGRVHSPFQMTSKGYFVKLAGGVAEQVYGEHYPEWRKATKDRPSGRGRRLVRLNRGDI